MPHIEVAATMPDADPDEVFVHVARFDSYPDIAANVVAVEVSGAGPRLTSSWEVTFRKGILKWEEEDLIDGEHRRIAFSQTKGDLAVFLGEWNVTPVPNGTRVTFGAEFDLGIPSLASMLNPSAARTLAANARELIVGFATASGDAPAAF